MGKKAKEHRAKVEKRNRKVAQERYAMQNALNKMMKQMAEQQEAEKLNVTVGGQEVPFSVVDESELNSIVEFKEENAQMLDPEFDSAGYSVEDREEPQIEDQISELEK
jgi:hypothetical protein